MHNPSIIAKRIWLIFTGNSEPGQVPSFQISTSAPPEGAHQGIKYEVFIHLDRVEDYSAAASLNLQDPSSGVPCRPVFNPPTPGTGEWRTARRRRTTVHGIHYHRMVISGIGKMTITAAPHARRAKSVATTIPSGCIDGTTTAATTMTTAMLAVVLGATTAGAAHSPRQAGGSVLIGTEAGPQVATPPAATGTAGAAAPHCRTKLRRTTTPTA
uniref:Uncharacterized protein n=1 Tax=Arundo donax TaxID=35708 RepID=A0A0A8ZS38_ARUDO